MEEKIIKLTKVERLQNSIKELNLKINTMVSKRDQLLDKLEKEQNKEILDIMNSHYKTAEELTEFLRKARKEGYTVTLIQDNNEGETNYQK